MFNAYFKKSSVLKEAEGDASAPAAEEKKDTTPADDTKDSMPKNEKATGFVYYVTVQMNENGPDSIAANKQSVTGTTEDIRKKIEEVSATIAKKSSPGKTKVIVVHTEVL